MTYWSKRQEQLYKAMEKDEEKLKKRLSSFYDSEQRKLEKQIAAYYAEYGTDEVIRYRNLMQQLSDEDRALLIEQMDAFAEKYPQYADLMPIRESIYKLNRLEGLEYSVKMQQLEIGAVNNEEIEKYLNKQALKGVNAAAEAMGFGKAFYAENSDIIKKFVNVPWSDGKNFSTRIWENGNKLANYLSTDIAQGFARGDSYSKLVKQVQQRFSRVTRNDAYRLIYTEGTYVMAEATMQPFENDFEKYRISTVGDSRVCPICKGISSEVFDIADRVPGVNFPPFHAWCRCTFTIEVDDWESWMDEYEKSHGHTRSGVQVLKHLETDDTDDILKLFDKADIINSEVIQKEKLYAERELGVIWEGLQEINPQIAQMLNDEMTAIYETFGNLNSMGVLNKIKYYHETDDWIAAYHTAEKSIYLRDVTRAESLDKMIKQAITNYKHGFWSTSAPEHVFRHELGHAVHEKYLIDGKFDKLSEISTLRKEITQKIGIIKWDKEDREMMKKSSRFISYYALESDDEFIAEAIAEYMAGNPRGVAKSVVDILLR